MGLNVTLEEFARMRWDNISHFEPWKQINLIDLSLDQIIDLGRTYPALLKAPEKTPPQDVDKTLQQVIEERDITPVFNVRTRRPKGKYKVKFRPLRQYKTTLEGITETDEETVATEEGTSETEEEAVVTEEDTFETEKVTKREDVVAEPGRTVQKRKLVAIEPKATSSTTLGGNEAAYKAPPGPYSSFSEQVSQRQNPNITPYRTVGFLSETGLLIEVKVGKLSEESLGTGDLSHLWRCVVACGEIKGIADSVRKVVAREMACVHFLSQLRELYKDCEIGTYVLMDEILIDPKIFHLLEKEARAQGHKVTNEVRVKRPSTTPSRRSDQFVTYISKYFVGPNKFKGSSFIVEYAKLIAARQAYEFLTGKPVKPTRFFTGKECDLSVEYDFSESVVYQNVVRREPLQDGGEKGGE